LNIKKKEKFRDETDSINYSNGYNEEEEEEMPYIIQPKDIDNRRKIVPEPEPTPENVKLTPVRKQPHPKQPKEEPETVQLKPVVRKQREPEKMMQEDVNLTPVSRPEKPKQVKKEPKKKQVMRKEEPYIPREFDFEPVELEPYPEKYYEEREHKPEVREEAPWRRTPTQEPERPETPSHQITRQKKPIETHEVEEPVKKTGRRTIKPKPEEEQETVTLKPIPKKTKTKTR